MDICTVKIVLLNVVFVLFGCQNHENIESYLNELHQEGKLNGNVLVMKNGETLYEKSFGYADGSRSTLLNKNYRFNIGSVYKEFPAVAIMQLYEKKRIGLYDKIQTYLPELPEWSEQITIKHLLQYSSGLPTINWDGYFGKGLSVSDKDLMKDLLNIKELEFQPGSDYLYTNNSPFLLMKIVEKVTDQQFSTYAKEHLFILFNLNNTAIKDQYPYLDKTLMAIPFDQDFKEDDYQTTVSNVLFSSTARDMYHWFNHLDSFEIVSRGSVQFLSEEAVAGDNIQAPLGRVDWKNNRMIEHSHHGSSANYECVVRHFKQEGLTIVILTNQKHGNVYDISDEIHRIVRRTENRN
jgi:CubicO group peptidase (beta-lactamase class C family)